MWRGLWLADCILASAEGKKLVTLGLLVLGVGGLWDAFITSSFLASCTA